MEQVLENKKVTLLSMFKIKAYFQLLSANVISRFGDSIDMIAYSWMVYQLTGSELLLGTIFMVNAIPNIIFGPFVGVLVDHLSKRKLIVVGDILRGLIVSLTAILFFYNLLEVYHLFIFTFCISTVETFVNPSKTSIFSLILKDDEYLKGSSISQAANSVAALIGAGAAGILIATIGISGTILVDGATFFTSSIIFLFLKFKDVKSEEKLNLQNYLVDFKEGFKFIKSKKIIFISILLIASLNLFLSPVSVLMPVYVKKVLDKGAMGLSYISIALSVGTIIGGIIISIIDKKLKKSIMIVSGNVWFSLMIILLSIPAFNIISFIDPIFIAILAFFFIGFSTIFMTAPLQTYILQNTPKEIIGRVFAILSMFSLSMLPIGGAITGVIASMVPLGILYFTLGCIILVISFLPLLNKEFRKE